MPTLNWNGKDAVINHHLEMPFHLLKDVPELACGDPGSRNLIGETGGVLIWGVTGLAQHSRTRMTSLVDSREGGGS
ncbi:MAG: hypothetical protein ACOYMN_17600 [Roseimicrobium sp.]